MLQNPAVLQCGPSLEALGAAEIEAFAKLRAGGNALMPPEARPAALAAVVAAVGLAIAGGTGGESAELDGVLAVLRPALGVVFGSAFLFTAYASAR